MKYGAICEVFSALASWSAEDANMCTVDLKP